jgi:transposase
MSRPPSVRVTRASPDLPELVKLFKKEKDGDKVRRLHAIIHMRELNNAEEVARLCFVHPNTVRRWVEAFNEGGLDALYKKKVQDDAPS